MKNPEIYTIGYGNRKWEIFLELLQEYKITRLADIRTLPFSRFQPAFRRNMLEKELPASGIMYRFLGDALGGRPDDPSVYVNGRPDYDRMETLLVYQEGIEKLISWAKENRNICIMCAELKPGHCHRKNLVGRTLVRMGITVKHIDEKGQLRLQEYVDEGKLF